jgi:hypothetical protein
MILGLQQLEYEALRATIRQRGTARLWLFWASLVAWGETFLVIQALGTLPAACALISLLILVAGFESVAALHFGVERIGRYLQVAYEDAFSAPADFGWERAAMEYGRRYETAGIDPLFTVIFAVAALLNLLPVARAGSGSEQIALVSAHLLFVARLIRIRRAARRQREEDLTRFRALLNARSPGPSVP